MNPDRDLWPLPYFRIFGDRFIFLESQEPWPERDPRYFIPTKALFFR